MGENKAENRIRTRVRRPMQRTLLLRGGALILVLIVLFAVVSYFAMSNIYYSKFNDKLTEVITYVEHNADADDLEMCIENERTSEKYDAFQSFLNGIIDDLALDYLYIVIPTDTLMINLISATSEAEREAGEADMSLLETSDAYSYEELMRYRSFWNSDEIGFFEESSEWGSFYTGIKPLRNSSGETVALICADISTDLVHSSLNRVLFFSILFAVLSVGLFGVILMFWLRKEITKPLLALKDSALEYAKNSEYGAWEFGELHYEKPEIKTGNEVESLGDAIYAMTEDINARVKEVIEAERRAEEAERENERLAAEAESAAKIAELSGSLRMLLNYMPALTYMKDIETGKYLACNAQFAAYAGKKSPDEVIGLTDSDIYDPETAKKFFDADLRTLEMDKPYIYFENAADGTGTPKQFQTTKLKYKDSSGALRVLGMSIDVTEMMKLKEDTEKTKEAYEKAHSESVTYSKLAHALSLDYEYLYYVDTETDYFIEYGSDAENEAIIEKRSGGDFFGKSRRDAMTLLHEDDREMFVGAFNKENILKSIEEHGMFTLTYRMINEGTPVYFSMKATLMKDGRHLIFGIFSVDEQMRYQETIERVKEERITYSRINALSGDYICIYTVDPESGHYIEYSTSEDYAGLGLAKTGDDFFKNSAKDSRDAIYPEDYDRFNGAFTKENVMKEIEENGIFIINYRLMMGGEPTYVSLKAALVAEKDGPQLIVGVVNTDRQVKRDQEYEYKLSVEREKANIDALTGVRNKHAYIDVESQFNRSIEEGEAVDFALAVFDVNGLKRTNDTEGHRAGDILIRTACSMICGIFKHSPVFRIGGDEFAVVAQGEDLENLDVRVAEVARVNEAHLESGGAVVACGTARYSGERSVSAVFEKADSLMYENKKALKGERTE